MFYEELLSDRIVLVDGRRTPTGNLLGGLSGYTAPELGALCLEALTETVNPRDVDELVVGSVLQGGQGQAPARQVLLGADWSPKIPAVTINKVCGSGIKAILQSVEAIRGGPGNLRVAGGTESMSNAPHAVPGYRAGKTLGDGKLIDLAVHDGLWCSIESEHMGNAAERIARRYDLSREELDEYSLRSHQLANQAESESRFDAERLDVEELDRDEPVRPNTSLEKLSDLPPAFEEDGVVTAGNAPGLNDGAAFLVVQRPGAGDVPSGLDSVFTVEAYSVVGDEPGNLFETPAAAIELILENGTWSLDDFEAIEINEAFASQVLGNCHRLELDPERVNRWGGAIALGHPIGMSGARIVLTLMNQMRQFDEELGIASICMGGGNGIALVIRQEAV